MTYEGQLTLGQLITALEQVIDTSEDKQTVRYDFCNMTPTTCASYRGFYSDLALGFNVEWKDILLGGLIAHLKKTVGVTFQGWKGGDYVMSDDTPLWVANRGETSDTAITGVRSNGYQVVIETAFVDVDE